MKEKPQIAIVFDKELATWLLEFLAALVGTFSIGDLNKDTINARQAMQTLQRGLEDAESTTETT